MQQCEADGSPNSLTPFAFSGGYAFLLRSPMTVDLAAVDLLMAVGLWAFVQLARPDRDKYVQYIGPCWARILTFTEVVISPEGAAALPPTQGQEEKE